MERADIEESKRPIAMNAPGPQASYPCGNFSDTSSRKPKKVGQHVTGIEQKQSSLLNLNKQTGVEKRAPNYTKRNECKSYNSNEN